MLSILDVCNQPVSAGQCDQWQTRYYFHPTRKTCEPFAYSSCGGTGNRFTTQSECESVCIVREEPIPMDNKGKYRYVTPFEVKTLNEGFFSCNQRSKFWKYYPIAVCALPVETGNCSDVDSVRRWFYDDSRGQCVSFIYTGCGGNQNNFRTFESCIDFCISKNAFLWLFAPILYVGMHMKYNILHDAPILHNARTLQ